MKILNLRLRDQIILIILIIVGIFRTSELLLRRQKEYEMLKLKDKIERNSHPSLSEIGRLVEILKKSKYAREVNLRYWVYYLGEDIENYKFIEIFKTIIETRPPGDPTRHEAVRALTKVNKNFVKYISSHIFSKCNLTDFEKDLLVIYFADNGGEEITWELRNYLWENIDYIRNEDIEKVEKDIDKRSRKVSGIISCIWGLSRIGNQESIKFLKEILSVAENKDLRDIIKEALTEAEKKLELNKRVH